MMTKFSLAAVCVGLVLTVTFCGAQQTATKKKEPSAWMKAKLTHSQEILEGMATGDYEMITQGAEAMGKLSKIEAFVRGKAAKYRSQLHQFQDANEEIIRQAEAKNIEGVALAFNQLTMSCVNCHKQLRKEPAAE